MSVLVDTGVFVAFQNKRDENHEAARHGIRKVLEGELGHAYTSDYVFDEAVTLTLKRTRSHKEAMIVANRILGRSGFPKTFDLLTLTGPSFRDSMRVFEEHDDQGLSFTDAATVALMRRRGIDHVLSFDKGLDGLVSRLDPRYV